MVQSVPERVRGRAALLCSPQRGLVCESVAVALARQARGSKRARQQACKAASVQGSKRARQQVCARNCNCRTRRRLDRGQGRFLGASVAPELPQALASEVLALCRARGRARSTVGARLEREMCQTCQMLSKRVANDADGWETCRKACGCVQKVLRPYRGSNPRSSADFPMLPLHPPVHTDRLADGPPADASYRHIAL